jgi:hypothetical protein
MPHINKIQILTAEVTSLYCEFGLWLDSYMLANQAPKYSIQRMRNLATKTGHTQNNGAVSIVYYIEAAPFFCVCLVLD